MINLVKIYFATIKAYRKMKRYKKPYKLSIKSLNSIYNGYGMRIVKRINKKCYIELTSKKKKRRKNAD